jgi:hypothetical protein
VSEPKVRWDDARARRAYANECGVTTTVDEIIVAFGVNRGAGIDAAAQDDALVEMTQRIVLAPHVAKRLAVLLDQVVRDHEARFAPREPERAPGRRDGAPGGKRSHGPV